MANDSSSDFTILVVDDDAENIDTLGRILSEYEVRAAITGKRALAIANATRLDLILLDILMPEMSGYEVCEKLKSNKQTMNVPVIFITVMGSDRDELKGLSLGAVDYITKPFSPAIVQARVKTHLELKEHRDNLEAMVTARTEQLIHAERLAILGTMAAGLAHEINSPLAGLVQNLQVVRQRMMGDIPGNHQTAAECGITMGVILSYAKKRGISDLLDLAMETGYRATSLVRDMLEFSRKDDGKFGPYKMDEIMDKAIALAANDNALGGKVFFDKIKIRKDYEADLPLVQCEASRIEQVFLNIIQNGIQAMKDSVKDPGFVFRMAMEEDMIRVEMENNGPCMEKDVLDQAFEPFFTTKKTGSGTGLGLYLSYIIVTEQHLGKMGVETMPERGSNFIIRLPIARETDK